MVTEAKRLPYGMGRFTVGWYLLTLALLVLIVLGGYAYATQFT